MSIPSIAVRNALAFVDLTGNYASHAHLDTRIACLPYVTHIDEIERDAEGHLRFYKLNAAGREAAAKSTLAPVLAYLKAKGFRLWGRNGYHRLKPGFITFRGPGESEAFISRGRHLYVKRGDGLKYEEVKI